MTDEELRAQYTQEAWDARYAESDRVWSGRPNQRLVEQVADLPPGRALDVGCGEGADSVWLAQRGWRVSALDVSQVALDRTRQHAAEAGVAELVEPLHHDLLADGVPDEAGRFDLVSVFFLHVPRPDFDDLYGGLAGLVAPGGSLLVVAHHPDDLVTGVRRPRGPDLLFRPEQVVAVLDEADWEVAVADAPRRQMDRPEGPVTVRDTVVRAVRR